MGKLFVHFNISPGTKNYKMVIKLDKVLKNVPSKTCGRQPFYGEYLKEYVNYFLIIIILSMSRSMIKFQVKK